ncbi:AMP-binding protein [Xenorhabdus doucetiae]|uniref:AMP-dependent synthetase/ligase domain-containing protein n=1 Tax=Xenorhabdus doucetiae TaxID=351671 RepID=A0A068QX10_9GAMM|nr:AMP-binding protein [Xenorhabdus doucetiae]CDG19567.1 protein of unknown function [Xenorhabdus doucetiae]
MNKIMHPVIYNKSWEKLLNIKNFEMKINESMALDHSLHDNKVSIFWSSDKEKYFEYKVNGCLPGLFLSNVRYTPDNIAVAHEEDKLSFWQLAHLSLHVANYLRYLNCNENECIGVFVEPSLEQFIGIWGILFSGSAYLALAPDYPPERLKYMIDDSSIKYIFVQEKLKSKVSNLVSEEIILS